VNKTIAVKQKLAELLLQAVTQAQHEGKLPAVSLPDVLIERPQNPEHGDYASSIPLKLARAASARPLVIARDVVKLLSAAADIADIEVAEPGFINFTIKDSWLSSQVDAILDAGETYGNLSMDSGSRIQIEFVSVNPTGPLHVGHGRGAILGSTLAAVLATAGYYVEKEYYVNDAGNQIDAFSRSLYARYRQYFGMDVAMPSDGYQGSYMTDLAKEIIADEGERFLRLPEQEAVNQLGEIGLKRIIAQIRGDLETLEVTFDVWFSERSLFANGQYEKAMALLKQNNHLSDKENATWFISTALGDSRDNVVVRSDGTPTYFASDIAYHYNKFIERQFDKVIDIWGADHQGHVYRMKAAVGALGIAPEKLEIIISQMVTLRRGEEQVRLSKRSGDIITLREVVDEVGADACRFFFLARSADAQMDFDLELAKKQSAENPVYYVQYAHARIASILRLADEKGIDYQDGDVSLLKAEPELALIRKMLLLPEVIETIARSLQPHHLPYYAQELATVFHSFYKDCRVVSDDMALTKARLKLVAAAKTVLARSLHLMGITAPERM
jgi:arginyl-tRNA synthetase